MSKTKETKQQGTAAKGKGVVNVLPSAEAVRPSSEDRMLRLVELLTNKVAVYQALSDKKTREVTAELVRELNEVYSNVTQWIPVLTRWGRKSLLFIAKNDGTTEEATEVRQLLLLDGKDSLIRQVRTS